MNHAPTPELAGNSSRGRGPRTVRFCNIPQWLLARSDRGNAPPCVRACPRRRRRPMRWRSTSGCSTAIPLRLPTWLRLIWTGWPSGWSARIPERNPMTATPPPKMPSSTCSDACRVLTAACGAGCLASPRARPSSPSPTWHVPSWSPWTRPRPSCGSWTRHAVQGEPLLSEIRSFWQFVREERLFCSVLAHLLMRQGDNLSRFVARLNAKLPATAQVTTDGLRQAEIYTEFSYLRDEWFSLGRDNAAKRARILWLFGQSPTLAGLQRATFPETIGDFNQVFMGERGARIGRDIVYPGQWTTLALEAVAARFELGAEGFRDLCRFR
jgi:hypothetical protein